MSHDELRANAEGQDTRRRTGSMLYFARKGPLNRTGCACAKILMLKMSAGSRGLYEDHLISSPTSHPRRTHCISCY